MLSVILAATLATMAPGRVAAPDGADRTSGEKARVVSVHDADTITVRLGGRSEKVRLVGVDAPELQDERPEYRRVAEAAYEFARDALKGKTVSLEVDSRQGDRDRYARLLRYVILGDGTNFNEELVRKGYARVYNRFSFELKKEFRAVEAEAKRQQLGLWSLTPGKARQVPDAPH
jgi:micrococcal nuclease